MYSSSTIACRKPTLLSTPISIPGNKGRKSMYEYVFLMSLVCTPISFVYHLYVLACHSYVTRIYSYAIRMSFVCGFTMKRVRKKSTFIGTKHVQNVIKLKQNFLNNLFQYLHFFISLLGIVNFIYVCFQRI